MNNTAETKTETVEKTLIQGGIYNPRRDDIRDAMAIARETTKAQERFVIKYGVIL